MTRRVSNPRSTRRFFATCWGELDYVCGKMRYWLYARKQRSRAERYLERLAAILRSLPANDQAIIREEGLALLHELKGQRSHAIAHREREIQLMERLHNEARSAHYSAKTRSYLLRNRDETDLQERRAILERLKKEEL